MFNIILIDKAPRLDQFAGIHLTADEYHEAMQQDNTVIVDVRNAYETALGHFEPPAHSGATLLDPKLRKSNEFPNWLADPQTQAQLHGKKVLMYCTGTLQICLLCCGVADCFSSWYSSSSRQSCCCFHVWNTSRRHSL